MRKARRNDWSRSPWTRRARLIAALRQRDRYDRLRLYHPVTRNRAPIHAKILIVDDEILRVGSSNMNNRSMRLDSECDVTIDCTAGQNEDCADQIATIRDDLLAEHLGVPTRTVAATLARTGSLIATIEDLRFTGRKNGRDRRRTLVPYEIPDLSQVEA